MGKTLNEYFYKPEYGTKGITEMGKFDDCLDVADAEIKANKDARHTDYTNIVRCADYDHPDEAITAIASANKTLLVTEAETCDTNFTVPANVTVKFERGGKWTINNGITVTFNGQIEAGLWQIFAYTGAGVLAGSPMVNSVYPEWFGAVADNSTDCTDAITNAYAFIKSGGHLKFSEGTYLVTFTSAKTTVWDTKTDSSSNIVVSGNKSIIKHADGNTYDHASMFRIINSTNIKITNLIFDANTAGQASWYEQVHCLTVEGSADVEVSSCEFKNLIGDGIYIGRGDFGSGTTTNIKIHDNKFIANHNARDGVSITDDCHNINITNNYFYHITKSDMPGAICLEPISVASSNITITNNHIIGAESFLGTNGNSGIIIITSGAAVSDVIISDNIIEGYFHRGIGNITATNLIVTNNHIKLSTDAGTAGILRGNIIQGNVIEGSAQGIDLPSAKSIVSDNKITGSSQYGIHIGSPDVTIKNNLIIDCGGTGYALYGGINVSGVSTARIHIENNKIILNTASTMQTGISFSAAMLEHSFVRHNYIKDPEQYFLYKTVDSFHLVEKNVFEGTASFTWTNTAPTKGYWRKGEQVENITPSSGSTLGWVCINRTDTQMRVQANATDTTMEVDSTTGMLAGDVIGITLDDSTLHWTTIASITDADTLVITSGIPAGRNAPIDANVYTNKWQAMAKLETDGQIVFPATQAPSANANTLDDYEEGSWTLALKFGGNSVGMTGTFAGLYTKIGRMVAITGFLSLTAKGTSEGNATITGLPFTSKNDDGAVSPINLWLINVTFANQLIGYVQKNTSVISLEEVTEAGVRTNLNNTDFANDSYISVSVTYFTD